nr:hypothetical protein Itr_chr02CG14000 [Ipomoea trifida]
MCASHRLRLTAHMACQWEPKSLPGRQQWLPDSPFTATWAVTTGHSMWRTTISADSQCRCQPMSHQGLSTIIDSPFVNKKILDAILCVQVFLGV